MTTNLDDGALPLDTSNLGCAVAICLLCRHEACGWCPECHPEVPEWASN